MVTIQPARAVKKICESRANGCGINEINDMCYSIASAWSGGGNAYNVDPKMDEDCQALVEIAREKVYGSTKCNHQAPYRPNLTRSAPHFFPGAYAETNNKQQALQMCVQRCENREECILQCQQDAAALFDDAEEGFTTPDGMGYVNMSMGVGSENGSTNTTDAFGLYLYGIFFLLFLGFMALLYLLYRGVKYLLNRRKTSL